MGVIGIVSFSLTPSATKMALQSMPPVFVSSGRVFVAAIMAAIILWVSKSRIPTIQEKKSLIGVILGACIGFPVFTALAFSLVPASHGSVVLALLPLATAGVAVWRAGDRPSKNYWVAGIMGAAVIIIYALSESAGKLELGDLYLLLALVSAAYGYTEGAIASRTLGSWQTICWALVATAPLAIIPLLWGIINQPVNPTPWSWLGFSYLCIVSQLTGFFAWYKGLAIGGISKVGQIQLAQAPLGVIASAVILGEIIRPQIWPTLVLVIAMIVFGAKK